MCWRFGVGLWVESNLRFIVNDGINGLVQTEKAQQIQDKYTR